MIMRQAGFAYLYLLFALVIVSIALLGHASVRHYEARRQAEAELLRIGREFQSALASYRSSGDGRELPSTLEELLADERTGVMQRHLRRIYPDPITRTTDWGLVRLGGRIAGVYSLSTATPIKVAGFDPGEEHFEDARHYQDWRFTVVPSESLLQDGVQSPGQL